MKSNIQQSIDKIIQLQSEATLIKSGIDFKDSSYKQRAYKDKIDEISELRKQINKMLDVAADIETR